MSALACVCNGRIVYGGAGDTSGFPLLILIPVALLGIGLAVLLVVRRSRRRMTAAAAGGPALSSAPAAREGLQPVDEPGDVVFVVEPVGVDTHAGSREQADVHSPFP